MIDSTPHVLPHLNAQCLHIWQTQKAQMPDVAWEGNMGYLPPAHGIFCRDDQGEIMSPDGMGRSS